ncbi:MAG TPA: hypothetical protein VF170_07645 [Planctomycetaceae bacterium]
MIRVVVTSQHAGLREALAEALAGQPDLVVVGVWPGLPGDAAASDIGGEAANVLVYGASGFAYSADHFARCRAACRRARIIGLYTTPSVYQDLLAGGVSAAVDPADGLAVLLAAIRSQHRPRFEDHT